jgi:hypothetical protein
LCIPEIASAVKVAVFGALDPQRQDFQKPTISGTQSQSFHGTLQNGGLMTKSQDFDLKLGATPKRGSCGSK